MDIDRILDDFKADRITKAEAKEQLGFEVDIPQGESVLIYGVDQMVQFERVVREDNLEQAAKEIYEENPGESGYYECTKFLWVEFPDDRTSVRLDSLVPYSVAED